MDHPLIQKWDKERKEKRKLNTRSSKATRTKVLSAAAETRKALDTAVAKQQLDEMQQQQGSGTNTRAAAIMPMVEDSHRSPRPASAYSNKLGL